MNNPADVIQQTQILISQGDLAEAKDLLLNEYQHNQGDARILFGLGAVHEGEGDFTEAEKWLSLASDAAPKHPGIQVHLANTLSRLQKTDEAISHYQIAISINPDIFEAHLYLAGLLMGRKHLDDAEYHFMCAIKLKPDNADCYANLAQLYELLHKLEDARNAAVQALRLKSDHVGALMLMGKLEKREKHFDEAEKMFNVILANTTEEALIATVNIELGHVLDKKAQYDAAWNAFLKGKQAWNNIAADIPFDRQEYQKLIQQNTQSFKISNIEQYAKPDSITDSRPAPVFFVGFPRSGTTLTEQLLGQCPNTVTSNEQPFIGEIIKNMSTILDVSTSYPECLAAASAEDIKKLREDYWHRADSESDGLQDDSLLIDKLPLNIVNLGFISTVFPDSHILVAIRDPRDVCLSGYMQSFQLNPAMINFFDMESTTSFYAQVMGLWLHYRSVLPMNWHQYRYEDLVADFDKTTTGIFGFLGLDIPENLADFHKVASKKFIDTPSYQDVTTPLYSRSVARWKNYEKYLAPFADKLTPFIEEFEY